MPSPNGYDDLLSVIPNVVPNPGDWRTQDMAELRAALAPNSNALATIRAALEKEWAAPLSHDTNSLPSLFANLALPKTLANLFCAEGRLAELEHRTNDALNAFADCIQLGQKSTHRALIIHDLVGIACQAIGRRAAQTNWAAADDSSLQIFLDRLAKIDQSTRSAEEVIRHDQEWSRATYGLKFVCVSFLQRSALRRSEESLRANHYRAETELRLLRADVAIELFRRKNGRYPSSLSELVPQYLEAVPSDPFSGNAMIYRVTTNSYSLYSIGADKKDDGGKPLVRSTGGAVGKTPEQTGDLISTPAPSQ